MAPLSPQLSGTPSTLLDVDDEEVSLLRSPGGTRRAVHKHSLSGQLTSHWHALEVAVARVKPAPPATHHQPQQQRPPGLDGGEEGGAPSTSGGSSEGEYLTLEDLRVSRETREWLQIGVSLVPKFSWGWLPFSIGFLGFGVALRLLLFITLFSVFSAAIMFRLYQHSDDATSLADIGEAAFGKRLGRRPVQLLSVIITLALPIILHMAGTRLLQLCVFHTTPLCLPWVGLLFGGLVLGLGQVQRLGASQRLERIALPLATGAAVAATLLKLLLTRGGGQGGHPDAYAAAAKAALAPSLAQSQQPVRYVAGYIMAVIQLISANYCGQHNYVDTMSSMSSSSSFQHSTALAQALTMLANVLVGLAALGAQGLLSYQSFVTFSFGADPLSRLVNFIALLVMLFKYLVVLNDLSGHLLRGLPHIVSRVLDPDGVDADVAIQPRQLWLLASSLVVACSYCVSMTMPHTFLALTGLLTSVAHIPIAFTLPCLFSLKLLSNQISSLEYTLISWVVPVSLMLSACGVWTSVYHLVAKWHSSDHGGSWGCNLLQPQTY